MEEKGKEKKERKQKKEKDKIKYVIYKTMKQFLLQRKRHCCYIQEKKQSEK